MPIGACYADDDHGQRASGRKSQSTCTRPQSGLVERRGVQEVLQQLTLRLQFEAERVVAQQATDGQRVGGVGEHRRHFLHLVVVHNPPGHYQPAPTATARPHRVAHRSLGPARRGLRRTGTWRERAVQSLSNVAAGCPANDSAR